MKKNKGFTLIELVLFIIVIGIISGSILMGLNAVLQNAPKVHKQNIATESATRCIDYYLGSRYMLGYDAITCPSNTVPSFCTVPSGYTITTSVACTTLYGGANYKTVTVSVSGYGTTTLSLILADY